MIYGLDLFSGYGGITLGLQKWVRPVAYCEIDRYAQGILLSRMQEGGLPRAPIWDDIRTFPGKQFTGSIDILYGGFPCQNISVAGNGSGLAGEQSGLFYELCKLVKEIEPTFIFLENVPAIRTRGLQEVVSELTNIWYDCRWTCVSAKEVGAQHTRKRWFLLAYSNRFRKKWNKLEDWDRFRTIKTSENAPNPPSEGLQRDRKFSEAVRKEREALGFIAGSNINGGKEGWESEPGVRRVVDGCPNRMDRIKALGNGVVPIQAEVAFKRLLNIKV